MMIIALPNNPTRLTLILAAIMIAVQWFTPSWADLIFDAGILFAIWKTATREPE